MGRIVLTAALALAGVALFHLAQIPLPWLLGPIGACLAASLVGLKLKSAKSVDDGMRTILGVAVGATLTPAVLSSFSAMWPTLVLVPVTVLCIAAVGVPYFQRVWGYDFPTAYYAAMPGGLQDMLLFGQEAGGNVRTLSLVHATRVMVIVVALPFLLKGIWQTDLSNPPGLPASTIPVPEMLIMVFCAASGWWIAVRVGLFGASILGPMIVAAAAALAGFLHYRPPAEAIWAAQFFIGMSIGAKYSGVTMSEVRRDLLASLGFCVILVILTVIIVEAVVLTNLAPGQDALLAFAPGGQAELTVLALIIGADVAFVVAHHVLRIIVVILGAPLMMRLFDRR